MRRRQTVVVALALGAVQVSCGPTTPSAGLWLRVDPTSVMVLPSTVPCVPWTPCTPRTHISWDLGLVSNVDGQLDTIDMILMRASGETVAASHYETASIAKIWGAELSAHQRLSVGQATSVPLSISESWGLIIRATVAFTPHQGKQIKEELSTPLR